jgi:hypothetical protein
MLNVTVASHAHRKLRRLGRYLRANLIAEDPAAFAIRLPTQLDTIVGCYRNDGGAAEDWIVFTNDGISAMFDGMWRHISYSTIIGVRREDGKSIEDDRVCLELSSHQFAAMLVNGNNVERDTHDKYAIMMFIESAIAVVGEY